MALLAVAPIMFTVRRRDPELITPFMPTPREFKYLSDIDDQESFRFQFPFIQFYRNNVMMEGRDPVQYIRDAIARALVFYYPFAGRLREGPGRKLVVDCTGEGIIFIEADANVRLDQFRDVLRPPLPCLEALLYDVPGLGGVINCPLLLIQVTRLLCGGFIVAVRLNHVMSDASGLVQFLTAVGEMAHGARAPSVQPVWQRELLNARDPPQVTCMHPEYEEVPGIKGTIIPPNDLVHQYFFFGPQEVAALRKHLPLHHQNKCSIFEIVTACMWRCRTIALQSHPREKIRLLCMVNTRNKYQPPLPSGFYGNALAFTVALSTAGKLCQNSFSYALKLVKKAKANVTDEYMRSVADHLVIMGRPHFAVVGTYLISDVRRAGFNEVDFGWGKAVYGGPAIGSVGRIPGVITICSQCKNNKGEDGMVVPINLPKLVMQRFMVEMERMIREPVKDPNSTSTFIVSPL